MFDKLLLPERIPVRKEEGSALRASLGIPEDGRELFSFETKRQPLFQPPCPDVVVEADGVDIPIEYYPFHPPAAAAFRFTDAVLKQPKTDFPLPVFGEDEDVFQVEGRTCEERRIRFEDYGVADGASARFGENGLQPSVCPEGIAYQSLSCCGRGAFQFFKICQRRDEAEQGSGVGFPGFPNYYFALDRPFSFLSIELSMNPEHFRTGRRGYLENDGSVFDSLHRMNSLPFRLLTIFLNRQREQSPGDVVVSCSTTSAWGFSRSIASRSRPRVRSLRLRAARYPCRGHR